VLFTVKLRVTFVFLLQLLSAGFLKVTVGGYTPIQLNQIVRVKWKGLTWGLPLTSKKVTFNGPVHITKLDFGGIPLEVDDTLVGLAAEMRAEAYGKNPVWRKAFGAGDDKLQHEAKQYDESHGTFTDTNDAWRKLLPLNSFTGRSSAIVAASETLPPGTWAWIKDNYLVMD